MQSLMMVRKSQSGKPSKNHHDRLIIDLIISLQTNAIYAIALPIDFNI
ncbi:hypothetical protein GMMP1_410017 [Candidatus Magnetomoraceae bacterium gMMP-1]